MSGYSDANMLLAVFLLIVGSLSSTWARQLSLFQLAFEEPPKKIIKDDYLGATPAGTYPLIITPLNFAPGVVAPPAFLFPSPIRFPSIGSLSSSVRGAIPLFAPLKPFPYVKYLPVKTTFYLSEPNLRDPIKEEDPVQLPFKQGAPKPSFSPVRDTQVVRKPSKIGGLSNEKIKQPIEMATPLEQGMKQAPHFVRVVNFPAVPSEEPEFIPFKQGAPKPSFSPVRDTQVVRKPSKTGGLSNEKIKQQIEMVTPLVQGMKHAPHFVRVVNFPAVPSAEPEFIPFKQGAPKPSFSPIRDAQIVRRPTQVHMKESQEKLNLDQQLVRVTHFPTQLGGSLFETRDGPDVSLSAPAGIVQSGQPHFTFEPFSNAKLSQNLHNANLLDIRTENEDKTNLPTLIEV